MNSDFENRFEAFVELLELSEKALLKKKIDPEMAEDMQQLLNFISDDIFYGNKFLKFLEKEIAK